VVVDGAAVLDGAGAVVVAAETAAPTGASTRVITTTTPPANTRDVKASSASTTARARGTAVRGAITDPCCPTPT
jgi:hypothetical protein